jgi:hypothetical protein
MDTTRHDDKHHNGQGPGTWDRIKEALRRDWEQTKHEFSSKAGHELNQDIGDTLKQAAGKQPIPEDGRANPPRVIDTWDNAEQAIQFGYEAAGYYRDAHGEWSNSLDSTLADRWKETHANGRDWSDVKNYVRHGFEYGRREMAKGSVQ